MGVYLGFWPFLYNVKSIFVTLSPWVCGLSFIRQFEDEKREKINVSFFSRLVILQPPHWNRVRGKRQKLKLWKVTIIAQQHLALPWLPGTGWMMSAAVPMTAVATEIKTYWTAVASPKNVGHGSNRIRLPASHRTSFKILLLVYKAECWWNSY